MVVISCDFASGAQVGVWNFNNSLTNAIGGKSALSAAGGWTPTYVSETIAGSPATVMSFPAFDATQALDMPNDANPNGSGSTPTRNNWSIVMDVKFPTLGTFTGLWETDAIGSGDGDYFIHDARGIGISDQYAGFVSSDVWTRLAVTVDTTTDPGTYTVNGYIDGVYAGTATTGATPGGREAVKSFLHLFADNDLETSAGLVNSVAYYGEVISEPSISALGSATAAGIPAAANQAGLWNFNNNLNNSIGGKAAMSAVGGWTPTYVSDTIGGSPATVLSFPAFDNTQALDMPNQATPDDLGVATTTNIWSIVMDVKFPTLNLFTSLFNTDSPVEADGEYFIRDDSGAAGLFGGIGISSQYAGVVEADKWTRIAVTVDGSAAGGAYVVTGYIDGVLAGTATTGNAPNGREAIADILHVFGDEDGETAAGLINSLAFYDEVLTADAIAALGAASAIGIPVAAVSDADFDNNGVVDGADFLRWQRGFGINGGGTNAQGDADGNGIINAADLAIWKSSFGGAPTAAAVGAVPEPGSWMLFAVGAAAASLLRRRVAPVV
jgi:hypothetical protein